MKSKVTIPRLIAFDMDGTLLDRRVIYSIGERFGFVSKIEEISMSSRIAYARSRRIAKLLRRLPVSEFTGIVEAIPLVKGAVQTVEQLKDNDLKVGIISDSYTTASEIVARKLGMDFHVANELEIVNGIFTGRIKMPMGWERIGCHCRQSVCKHYHLIQMAEKYGVKLSDTVAVGDSASDICMIKNSGIGIWFNPVKDELPNGNYTIKGRDLRLILRYIK